ncbi:hypothetical protein [Granulosicoccus antarcticus]|uniref:DUF2867 domain-containing protein n=1 Tax=Granulosicoccus antarcticus IMCC3135 TaxID=1192854 RepID=A0A2Z2NHC3_9GAMM|nr:hypothetical protein [Granulosicoccus antarcticus]ASJ70692.1 hypothetical protein IMCC3135_02895 [Granulosicoccus antarcticus IMCC3135]
MPSHSASASDIPQGSLLAAYTGTSTTGTVPNYCDCYSTRIEADISLQDFVYAFYTSRAFSIERKLLALTLRVPSTDEDARALAQGSHNRFSAWSVENRCDNEILLRFPKSSTGSWLMVRPYSQEGSEGTELLFGSVVFPKTSDTPFGLLFHTLTGFHRFYSSLLLNSARNGVRNHLRQNDGA